MRSRFLDAVLWSLSGATWWLCAHSMTVIFPMPGPWLPIGASVSAGVLMGLMALKLAPDLSAKPPAATHQRTRLLMYIVGFVAGSYLGWTFARGSLTGMDSFLPATGADRQLSAIICGLLGLAANWGMLWLIARVGDRPLRLLSILLVLVALLFFAVFLTIQITFPLALPDRPHGS